MSIIIEKNINLIAPVYNRGELFVDSTNKNKDRFKYIVDIDIQTTQGTQSLGRLAVPSQPDTGIGRIEFHNILKDYVSKENNYDVLEQGFNGHFVRFELSIGERFKYEWEPIRFFISGNKLGLTTDSGLVSGGSDIPHEYSVNDLIYIESDNDAIVQTGFFRVVNVIDNFSIEVNQQWISGTSPNLNTEFADKRTIDHPNLESTSGTDYIFNGAITFDKWASYDNDFDLDSNDLLITSLNDIDGVIEVNIDDYFTANYYSPTSESLEITIGSTGDILTTTSDLVGTVGIGPANINDAIPNTLEVGDEYEIKLQNSKVYKFKIVERCSKFKNNKIIWLDRLGGWKSFNFELHTIENLNVTNKTTFNKENIGTFNTSTKELDVDKTEHYQRTENLQFNKSYNINSDRLTQNQIFMLEDLFTSRYVYLLENQNTEQQKLTPINLTDNNYEIADLLYRRRKTLNVTYRRSEKKYNN